MTIASSTLEPADFLIVGAGSAGCVLASRLSEDERRRVVLVEAGPDYADPSTLPPEIRSGHRPAFTHDWGFKNTAGVSRRSVDLNRARLVGGCSATNATLALRGAPADYDEWSALGNPGWSYQEVLPHFRRLERDLDFGGPWHGTDGPIAIRRYDATERTVIQQAFLEAAGNAGHTVVADHNAPTATGVGPIPVNTLDGVRQSAALTYLAPARGRPNLHIAAGVLADRVTTAAGRATGVALASGAWIPATTVILASGAYGSPAILLRSGIGPRDELARHGIECVAERPGVGRNLIDHPLTEVLFATPCALADDRPVFQMMLTLASRQARGRDRDLQIFPRFDTFVPSDETPTPTFALLVGLMKPRSRGWLALSAADPVVPPTIHAALLEDRRDVATVVEGVKEARRIARTPPLSDLAGDELAPGGSTDAELETAVVAQVQTYFHPVGTCRIGPVGDPGAVVDASGRVHGVGGLHVIDASIMPTIPSVSTNVPTLMIAERLAEQLRQSID